MRFILANAAPLWDKCGMDPKQLREKRKKSGLSQEKLARLLDVSYVTIASWEAGKTTPSIAHARMLSGVLDWPLAEMLGA